MTTTTIKLTPSQQATLDHARKTLAAEHGHGVAELAYRIGQLEWHLGEVLALAESLTGNAE